MKKVSILLVILILATPTVHAYCYELTSVVPHPPDPPSNYQRPDVPFCLNNYSWQGTHDCDDWEIDSYFDDVNNYIRLLDDYIQEAESFANKALLFAQEAAKYASVPYHK